MPNRPITRKEAEAWKFAKSAHKGQMRRFIGQSYFDAHVKKVNAIVKQHTTDEDILCAAILHDVAEDCYDDVEVGLYEIGDLFGSRVESLVTELTSSSNEINDTYEGDKAAYLADKMIHMSDDALIIKLADRLQNISDAFTANDRFRRKYFEQTWKIVDDIEKHRSFNRIHLLLLNEIKAKLNNIGSIFRIKRFDEMSKIKTYKEFSINEDFNTSLIYNLNEILSPLRKFSFNVELNSEFNRITISISKVRGEEIRVFQSSDVSVLLGESDKYLSLGEGLNLESVFLETIEGSKELESINSLKRERVGLLSIYISYNLG